MSGKRNKLTRVLHPKCWAESRKKLYKNKKLGVPVERFNNWFLVHTSNIDNKIKPRKSN